MTADPPSLIARSLIDLLRAEVEIPAIRIVDIGANPLTGEKGPYQGLVDRKVATIIGFEPDPAAFAEIQAMKGPGELYVPKAIGDGGVHRLRICQMSGMNSLLEPNFALLDLLHYHGQWARVLDTVEVQTARLDDVAEVAEMDYLKIDIQGGELMVFEHAQQKLADCLLVHTECMFVPMYVGQPLFSEQEMSLRRHGLMVHKFTEVAGHILKPLVINNDPHAPLSQIFWADVVFIKDITKLHLLTSEQLLKLAVILYDVYHSHDVVHLLLREHDERHGTQLALNYCDALAGKRTPEEAEARQ